MLPAALPLLGVLTAVAAPRLLARAVWPDREPVVAPWVRQCVIAGCGSRGRSGWWSWRSERPDARWLPGTPPQPVVTTGAVHRLRGRRPDAVLAHEWGRAARHERPPHRFAAPAGGFPQVPVSAAFRDGMHRLAEPAADGTASRRSGRLTTALALVELDEYRGVFGPGPPLRAHVPARVRRLLTPPDRLEAGRRLRLRPRWCR